MGKMHPLYSSGFMHIFFSELFRYSSFVDIKQRKGRPEGKGTTIQVHKSNIFANFLIPRS